MNVPQNNPNSPSAPQNIDEVYDLYVQDENSKMMQSVSGSIGQDPDAYAKAQQLGMQMGVGADIANRNMSELMRQQQMDNLQARNLSAFNPVLARQLSDPEFAAIAHDDIPNLLKSDEFWQSTPFTGNSVVDWAIPSGIKASIVGGVASAKMIADEFDLMQRHRSGDKAAYDEWQKLDAERGQYGSLGRGFIGGTAEVIAQQIYGIPTVLRDATVGASIGATAGALGGVGVFDWATIPAGAIGGAAMGAGIGMARNAFQMESGNAYFNMVKAGYDQDVSAYTAYGVGAINAALEVGGLAVSSQLTRKAFSQMLRAAIAERAEKAGIAKSMEALARPGMLRGLGQAAIGAGKGVLAESAEEVSQDIVQALGAEFARILSPGDIKSRFSNPGEMGRFAGQLADTFIQTAEATVLLQVPGMAGHIYNSRTLVNKAKQTARFYEALAKAADGKLKVRAPGAAEAFHAAYADKTDAAKTYVGAMEMERVLNQANLPTEVENELFPGVRLEIEKQKQVDGDIVFPTARYAARIAGTPLGDALQQHMRLDPKAPSLARALEIERETREMEAAREFEARSILAEKEKTDKAFVESANKVQDRYETELKAAVAEGRSKLTPDQISQAATAYRDWVVVMASKLNRTPEEFDAENGLAIRGMVAQDIVAPLEQASRIDAEYMAAVERGDTEAAQRMVDDVVGRWIAASVDAGNSIMPSSGTTSGNVSLPLYRYVDGDKLTSPERGMHWTHSRKDVEDMASNSAGFLIVAKHPGFDRVLSWEAPSDRPMMEREIGGYEYRDRVFPEVPIRPGQMDIVSIIRVDSDGNRTTIKSADAITRDEAGNVIPLSRRFDIAAESAGQFDQAGRRKTDTPEFRNWFGQSKVVDAEGKPLVVYHGTDAIPEGTGFTTFFPGLTGNFGRGIYFSPSPEVAGEYAGRQTGAQVLPVYVSLQNPLRVGWEDTFQTEVASALGLTLDEFQERMNKASRRGTRYEDFVTQSLQKAGFDGVIATNSEGKQYVVAFDPKQIKSVNNRGTWSTIDPNILNQDQIAREEDAAEDEQSDDVVATEQPPVPVEVDDLAVLDAANKIASSRVWDRGRDLKVELQRRVLDKAKAAGVDLASPSPETIKYLVRVGLRDAMTALKQNPNAVGWYDIKTRQALAVMALIHPEIATDANARFAFTWALAVTSNGLKVDKNFELAEQVYRTYKKTKAMPTNVGIGTAKKSINKSLGLFNELVAEWGMDDLRKFMQTNFTVGEIAAISKDLKPGGEHVGTEVRGSAILGPKIGNGFFSNLYGNFSSLTMDRWLIRTWGRWTGTLIKQQPNQTASAKTRLENVVLSLSADQIAEFNALLEIDVPTASMEELSTVIQDASADKKLRKRLNEIDSTEEFRKAGNSLAKYLDGQKEQPSGPGERTFIREVFAGMLAELKQQTEYADLTMADLQAALWYAEKRLYESAKEDITDDEIEGYTDEDAPDYANAAVAVAKARKVSKAKISEALKKEQDRDRAAAIQSGDEQARYESEGNRAAPASFSGGEKRIFAGAVATRRIRIQRQSGTTGSWSYQSKRSADGGRVRLLKNLNVRYVAEWNPGRSIRAVYAANGAVAPRFVELEPSAQSALEFRQRIQASKDSNAYGAAVYVYPAEDYEKMRLFLSEDGNAGVAVKPDGDIVSVFSMPKTNMGRAVMELALAAGGTKLDAFETILPSFYAAHGFKVVSRLKWDDSQAPSNWDKRTFKDFNNGEPDVVFMVYDPKSFAMHQQGKTGAAVDTYDIAVDTQQKAQKRLAASVRRERQLDQAAQEPSGRRGGYDPMRFVMMLNQASDISTVLHEMGHHFFSIMSNVAAQDNAPAEIVADTDILLNWFGIEGDTAAARLAAWNGMSLEEQRPYHEQFAYSLELYYFEGKAPSVELQGVFDRFTVWLKRVYKSIATELNDIYKAQFGKDLPFLTDEVRGVFDRMLATDEQIRRAQEIRSMMPIFQNQEQSGMTDAEWAAYQQMDRESTQSAISDLTKSSLRQMQYLSNARGRMLRGMQAEHDERRREIRRDVQAEVAELPVYRAMRYFRTGEYKNADGTTAKAPAGYRLSNSGVLDVIQRQPGFDTKTLEAITYIDPDKIPNNITSDEGIHPDAAADMFGFSSGNELLRALTAAKPMSEEINQRTDARMLSEFGEMLTPAGKEAVIERALHNDARARFVAVELRFIAKITQPVRIMLDAAKRVARQAIGEKTVKDLRPSEFVAAETRAALEAERAYRGLPDPETAAKSAAQKAANKATEQGLPADQIMAAAATAAEQARMRAQERVQAFRDKWGSSTPEEIIIRSKRSQLLQNQMAREATDALDEIKKGLKYLRNVLDDANRKRMGADNADQIAAILSKFELRPVAAAQLEITKGFDAWITAMRERGLEPDIPEFVSSDRYRVPYRNLSVQQFRDLVDSIKEIEYLGKNERKLLLARKRADFEEARNEMVASIEENAGGRKIVSRTEQTNLGRGLTTLKGFAASHLKAASIARILDGGVDGGPVWEYLIRTANERGDKETTMRGQATEALMEIMAPVLAQGKMGGAGVFYPSIGRSLNREARFAVALNMGNDGNIQRLLDGEGWSMEQIMPVLQSLTATEWDAVQKIWDYFESYRPMIAAKEREIYGKEPKWVEPRPMTLALADGNFASLRGGYYPIRYDTRASLQSKVQSEDAAAKAMMRPDTISATTRRSYVKTRANEVHDRPILLATDAMYSGINEVIHDLCWHTWVMDANRLMNSNKFEKAVADAYGPEFMYELNGWVKAVAIGERLLSNSLDKAAGYIRQNVSAGALAFQIMSAVSQITGFSNSAARIGPKWVARGFSEFAANPRQAIKMVQDLSEFMRNRARTQFRELNELKNLVRDQTGIERSFRSNSYFLMMQMQRMVDVPTWLGAYEKARMEHSESDSIAIADQAVIDSQGSGMLKDLSSVERGPQLQRLFTVFYSFMNTVYNQAVVSGYTKSRGQFAADMLMLFVVPVVLGRLLKEAIVPSNDDDPEYWKNLARRLRDDQISYLLGTMVMVRELTEFAQIMAGGKSFGYTGPAGLRLITDLQEMAKQTWQGELDRGFRKAAINIIGDFTGVPSLQINRTLDGIEAIVRGQTISPLAPLVGVTKPNK